MKTLDNIIDACKLEKCEGFREPCENLGKRTRQGTQYPSEEDNYATLCEDCQEHANEYWSESFQDYYSTIF